MPSSNPNTTQPAQDKHIGTIFLGPSRDRETTLDKLYSAVQTDVWNKKTENDYMERVRERAAEKVRALLTDARKKADGIHTEAQEWADTTRELAEATQEEARRNLDDAKELRQQAHVLRESAHKEGFEEGRQQALKELDEAKAALADTTAAVLLGIHQQCSHIFDTWREDLVALFKEALEKATGWILDEEKAKIMESLLTLSMKALQDKRRFMVRVHPQDAELLTEMLADAHKANPHTANWELESDPKLAPGSIVVESDSGLVNNSRESRRAVVEEVLQHLTLPHSQVDDDAMADITYTLVTHARDNGIDLDPEGTIVPHNSPTDSKAAPEKTAAPDTKTAVPEPENTIRTPQEEISSEAADAAPISPVEAISVEENAVKEVEEAPASPPSKKEVKPAAVNPEASKSAAQATPEKPEKIGDAVLPNLPSDEEIHTQAQDLVDSFLADTAAFPNDEALNLANPISDTESIEEDLPDAADVADIDPFEAALAASAATAAPAAPAAAAAPKKAPGEPLPANLADELLADLGFAASNEVKADN